MAKHLSAPLYYERLGRSGPPMVFVHPNPMDQSCWLFQMAHFSSWFRCIAIDVPGYGRSPKAEEGLTLADMAEGCWEAVDAALNQGADARERSAHAESHHPKSHNAEAAILVGCSVGSSIIEQMFHLRPRQTAALVLSGTGYNAPHEYPPAFVRRRIADYSAEGVAYRWRYTFQDFSPAFGASPLAHYFANLFTERNAQADVDSIIRQFHALGAPRQENFFTGITCPSLILTGTEDAAHASAFELKNHLPDAELRVLPGAGHACHMEQPWLFDQFMIEFLKARSLFP